MALTQQQLQENVDAMIAQGANERDVNDYLNLQKNKMQKMQEKKSGLGSIAKGVFNAVVVDPINTLLVTPADRLAEAVGRTGVLGDDIKRGYEAMQDDGTKRKYLGIGVERQKAFGEGATQQITGQTLKSLSYLAGGALAGAGAKAVTPATTILGGALSGAKAGAISGGVAGALGGSGEALYKGGTLEEGLVKGLEGGIGGMVAGGVLGGVLGGVSGHVNGRNLRRQELAEALRSGNATGRDFAEIKLAGDKVVVDPIGKKAVQTGLDGSDVAVMKSMTPEDRAIAIKMQQLAEKALGDKTVLERPADMVGNTFLKPVRYLAEKNQMYADKLDDVAVALKGQAVDLSPATKSFYDDLAKAGVAFADDGTPIYTKSIYDGSKPAQEVINKTLERLSRSDTDGYGGHLFKKFIDNTVKGYGQGKEGVLGTAEGSVKALRHNIDSVLDTTFPEYNAVNSGYSATRKAMEAVDDLLGSKFNLSDKQFADIKAGSVMRRILGNNAGRGDILKTIQYIDDIARQNGFTGKESAIKQMLFADTLEDIYGTQATTGLQGQVDRAMTSALKKGQSIFTKPVETLVEAGDDILKNVQGRTMQGRINAIRALLGEVPDETAFGALGNAVKTKAGKVGKEVYALGAPEIVQDNLLANNDLIDIPPLDGTDASTLRDSLTRQNNAITIQEGQLGGMLAKTQEVLLRTTANDHINTSMQVLQNLPEEEIAKLGGMPELLRRTKVNIVGGLAQKGADDLAKLVESAVDLSKITTLEQLAKAVASIKP